MRFLLSAAAAALVLIASAVPGNAQDFIATINGANERLTPVVTPGGGFGTLTIIDATTIEVNVQIANLLAPIRADGIDGHIHISNGGPNANGGISVVLFDNPNFVGTILGGPGNNFAEIHGTYTGNAAPSNVAAVVNALNDGNPLTVPYFNFHTTQFPGGEVRGNILSAPEPATLGLLGLGLGIGAFAVRRRR